MTLSEVCKIFPASTFTPSLIFEGKDVTYPSGALTGLRMLVSS